jgi:hypothetical protein
MLKKVKDPIDRSSIRPTEKPIFQARLFLSRERIGDKGDPPDPAVRDRSVRQLGGVEDRRCQ